MRKLINLVLVILILSILPGCGTSGKETSELADPWLWLEEIEGEKALEWVRAQNDISEKEFAGQPLYAELKERFLEVMNDKEQVIYPDLQGDIVYNLWQDEKNERGLWRRMKKEDFISGKSEWDVVLDLDKLSAAENRKWVFHGASWLGPDNQVCLLNLSDGGKDESVIREFDVMKREFITDGFVIDESKGSAAWVDRDNIIVATNYGTGTMTTSGYPRIVKLWKRGEGGEKAVTVLETDTAYMGIFVGGTYSAGRLYTFINLKKTFYETEMFLYDKDGLHRLDLPLDAEFYGMHRENLLLYLQSDWVLNGETFPKGSLVAFNIEDFLAGTISVKTVYIPDEKSSLESLLSASDFIVISALENVQSKMKIFRNDGGVWVESPVPVPEFGTLSLVSSDQESNDFFFSFSNPVTPPTLFRGNGKEIVALKKQKDYFNASGLTVKQYEAKSEDGTVIPYFIVHKSDIVADGSNPTLIYGYGGFNISELPYYSAIRGIGWMEQGGVYVIANIRGGGEFGPAWHQSAMKEKRQNAYNDFFAVAEDVINRKISSPAFMGAFGWSNGGLLAGVALTQRPDLYNAVVIGAPLLDMRRYSKMLAGASWMGEYGDPDKPDEWAYISRFSPYHNLSKDISYPEPLFITSTKDDRVHPGHARKMAAKMIDMGHPLFYHETIEGGHGAASTNAQEAEMWAMMYTYLSLKLKGR
ncbi:MAG: prolyl oligopeptidase family serine peptidase [Bacteroidales bacterium]|jgi:prolyl oligopeptidase|nr:prolyl oligopeptidase family serine peptidase [Bacteroidales bacterium]